MSYDTGLDLFLLLKSTGTSFENKKYLFTQIVQMESELYTPLIYFKITLDGYDPLVWQSKDQDYIEMRYDEIVVVRPTY